MVEIDKPYEFYDQIRILQCQICSLVPLTGDGGMTGDGPSSGQAIRLYADSVACDGSFGQYGRFRCILARIVLHSIEYTIHSAAIGYYAKQDLAMQRGGYQAHTSCR